MPRTPERIQALALSAGLALLGFLVAMALAYVVFGKRRRMENFAAAFCNAGFIGIPLAQAAIGEEGVFYVAASVALLNLFQWTYGVYIMADRRDAISARNVAKNPVVIGIIIGVVLFFTAVPVPGDRHLHPGLHRRHEYAGGHDPHGHLPGPALLAGAAGPAGLGGGVAMRLVVIPAVILLLFWLLPLGSADVAMAAFLAAATPVGANICVFAQQYGCDYKLSVVTVCQSTVVSIVTVPALVALAQMLL